MNSEDSGFPGTPIPDSVTPREGYEESEDPPDNTVAGDKGRQTRHTDPDRAPTGPSRRERYDLWSGPEGPFPGR